ncbi:MAG: relaxase/mobilization nuclease domain-containing protein [Acidithiobacillus ferriphilus]
MQKIRHGSDFAGVLTYALDRDPTHKKEPGRVIGGNVDAGTTAELTNQLQATADLRPDIAKPVWHQSLRLPTGEHLSDQKWAEVADDYMNRMGFTAQNPRVYIQHNDRNGEHIHIIANRIDLNGKCHNGSHESMKSTRIIAELEQRHGLTQTKTAQIDAHGKTLMPVRTRIKKSERDKALREQELPTRTKIQKLVDKVIQKISGAMGFTAKDLAEKLEEEGVNINPNISDTTGNFNGFSFHMDTQFFKGSQLGESYTKKGLTERGMTYDINTQAEALQKMKTQNKQLWAEKPDDDEAHRPKNNTITNRNRDPEKNGKSTPPEPEPFDYLSAIDDLNKDNTNAKNTNNFTTDNPNQHIQRPNFRPR